jgi:PAS domain S-box-containing protein
LNDWDIRPSNRLIRPGGDQKSCDEFDELPFGEAVLVLSTNWEILAANLPAERLLKIRLESGRPLRKEQIFTDHSLAQAELALREAMQTGLSRSDLKGEVKAGDGSTSLVEYSVFPLRGSTGTLIGALVTLRDQGVYRSPLSGGDSLGVNYDTLFNQMAEGLFTVNTQMRITYFNRRAQELTGYRVREVLGRFCWQIFQSDLCQSGCPLRTTMQTGQTRIDQDVRIIGKQGQPLTVLVNTSVIKDNADKILGAVETFRPLSGIVIHEQSEEKEDKPPRIVGQNPTLIKIMEMLPDVARSEVSVVVEGESGTGKELAARAIHDQSNRSGGPFVAVNTSALAETLLESELFGHENGSFTGAVNSKAGRFELFFFQDPEQFDLDVHLNFGDLIQEQGPASGQFERVGGNRPITMDCRIICATNKTLLDEVRKGRFRTDLFYRLRTVSITLPALRDRLDDIPLLVDYFVRRLNKKYGKEIRGVDPKVMAMFQHYTWPGNIRELQRVLEYAFVFAKGHVIATTHLPQFVDEQNAVAPTVRPPFSDEEECTTIVQALKRSSGRKMGAARILGISRSSLWRKMKKHGL